MQREDVWQVGPLGGRLRQWAGGAGALGVHLGVFLLAATALTLVNVARSPETLWFWRPLAAWLVLLAAHGAWVAGGVVRKPDAAAPDPPVVRVARADRASWTEPMRGHLAAAARGTRFAGGRAAARVAVAVASGKERAASRRSPATVAANGWSGDEMAAFAAWAQATDTWTNAHPPAESHDADLAGANGNGHVTPHAKPSGRAESVAPVGGRPARPGPADAATSRPVQDGPVPVPTGRFRAAPPETPPEEPGQTGWMPTSGAALWRPAAPVAAPNGGAPTTGGPGAAPSDNGSRLDGATGQDVVLHGPIPVDANDLQWASLEAAAAAWLAQRQTDVAAPGPSGNDHQAATAPDGIAIGPG